MSFKIGWKWAGIHTKKGLLALTQSACWKEAWNNNLVCMPNCSFRAAVNKKTGRIIRIGMQIVNTTIKSICFLLVSTAATLAFFQIALEIGKLFDCWIRFTYHKWTLILILCVIRENGNYIGKDSDLIKVFSLFFTRFPWIWAGLVTVTKFYSDPIIFLWFAKVGLVKVGLRFWALFHFSPKIILMKMSWWSRLLCRVLKERAVSGPANQVSSRP